jgi:hypothetical protein
LEGMEDFEYEETKEKAVLLMSLEQITLLTSF